MALRIPAASAVKIGGERAYRLHRRGVVVEMPVRRSRIDALELLAYEDGLATLDTRVSSGTYVRSLADVLGGHCRTLRRLEVGPFSVEEADRAGRHPGGRRAGPDRRRPSHRHQPRRREARSRSGAGRAPAARRCGGDVRRRPPRSSGGRPDGHPDGPGGNRRHLRPASAHRPRQQGRADRDDRAAVGALRGARRRDDARRRLHDGADASRAGGVRGVLPARDRRGGRRRR